MLRNFENNRARFHTSPESQLDEGVGDSNLLCVVPKPSLHASTCTSQNAVRTLSSRVDAYRRHPRKVHTTSAHQSFVRNSNLLQLTLKHGM